MGRSLSFTPKYITAFAASLLLAGLAVTAYVLYQENVAYRLRPVDVKITGIAEWGINPAFRPFGHNANPSEVPGFVEYQYVVDGIQHTSSRLGLTSFCSKKDACLIMSDMISNKKLQAWYDPLNPDMAVLDPTPPRFLYRMAIAFLLLGALATVMRKYRSAP